MRKLLVFLSVALSVPGLHAHQPVFSPRPETGWEGAFTAETWWWHEKMGNQKKEMLIPSLGYTFKQFLAAQVTMPVYTKAEDGSARSQGLGDLECEVKWRVFKKDLPGKKFQISLAGGAKLPTNRRSKNPSLSFRTLGFAPTGASTFGIYGTQTAAYESIHWYLFERLTYLANIKRHRIDKGNEFTCSLAITYRPRAPRFGKPDWAFLIESDSVVQTRDTVNGSTVMNSGGHVIFLGPSFGLGIKYMFLRAGIQVPIVNNMNGNQPRPDFRSAVIFTLAF